MKRFWITMLCIALPLATFAQADQVVDAKPAESPNVQNALRQNPFRQSRQFKVNANRNRSAKPEQQLERINELKPTTPKAAFSVHTQLLSERIERIQSNEQIPEDRKTLLVEKFSEELAWMQDKQAEFEAATTPETRQSIRQEIIDHVHAAQQERRQNLAETVALPERSPSEIAADITERFQTISDHLQQAGKNTTELNQAIQSYETAVTALADSYETVNTERTLEHLQALRDSIQTVRDAAATVRNSIQSIR